MMFYNKTHITLMVDTFTSNQLIRYVYNDCSHIEKLMLEEIASNDFSVSKEIKMLTKAKNFLPKALFSAHQNTIDRILNYSRKTA